MACLPRWEFLGISCSTSGPSHVAFWMLFPKHLRDQTNSKKQLSCVSQKTLWFPVGFLHNFWQTSFRVRSFVAISGFFESQVAVQPSEPALQRRATKAAKRRAEWAIVGLGPLVKWLLVFYSTWNNPPMYIVRGPLLYSLSCFDPSISHLRNTLLW